MHLGLLLDDPRDPAEIAKKLDQLLRATVTPPEEISRSVDAYRWDRVLLTYESILQGQCR